MVTVANTKMMVRPAKRMLSAISFGVFCRSAPSTSLIMRSMKVEPWAAVIRTLIQSDSTCVPPVTAERSPPDSRITGADSPVMAASLTEATPSITSPSEGMLSPASTSTTSPTFRLVPGTMRKVLSDPVSSLAWLSVRVFFSDSACALPRPSATASAKLANSTVNHSHRMIWNVNPRLAPPVTRSRRKMTVVSAATTSTTNITGFLTISRGSSLTKADLIAGTRIFGSSIVEAVTFFCSFMASMEVTPKRDRSEQGIGVVSEVLDDRPERQRREEGETADDQDHADDEAHEQAAGGRERAGRWRDRLLLRERARDRHRRHDHEEAADEHRAGERQVVEEGVAGQACESRAVVAGRGSKGVEHLGETVRAGIGHRGHRRGQHDADRRPAEIHQRQHQDREHRHLDLARLDLLADIFRRAADHQARHEDREHDEQQHAVEAGADATDNDLAELHIDQRDHAAKRGEAVMHGVDRATGGSRGDHGEQRGRDNAEADFLAFHIAAGQAKRVQHGSAVGLGPIGDGDAGDEQHAHDGEDRPALALVADHPTEHVGHGRADREDQDHLQKIRQRCRVLEGMRGVGIEEAATIGAEHLDG